MRGLLVCVAATLAAGIALGGAPLRASAGTNSSDPAGGSVATATQVIATAQQYVGYLYASIGDDPSTGFSCIGFVHFVFAQNGVYVPEDLDKAYASAPAVDQSHLQPGDLVFFQNTVWAGLSHVGLYIGNGQMIGADTYQTGVEVDNLSDPYWQEHYLGATRPLADPSGTPIGPVDATRAPGSPSLAPPAGPGLDVKAGTRLAPLHTATIYSGPGESYTAIDTVTPVISVTVVQTQGQWVNVSYDAGSRYGWLSGSDLNVPAAREIGAHPVHQVSAARRAHTQTVLGFRAGAGPTLVVTASVLFVRAGPGRQARILRRVHAGDRLRLLVTSHGWDYVVLRDNSRGWVSARWVR